MCGNKWSFTGFALGIFLRLSLFVATHLDHGEDHTQTEFLGPLDRMQFTVQNLYRPETRDFQFMLDILLYTLKSLQLLLLC
jgi:hypothetical protein